MTLVPRWRMGRVGLECQVSPLIPGAGRHWVSGFHGHVGTLSSSRVSLWTGGPQQAQRFFKVPPGGKKP